MKDNHFDLIVIGSGMGGLTVASLFSQIKKQRVAVLEQHFKLGGFTHAFRREGKYEWDVGLHYLGNLQKGSSTRTLMDAVTGGKVKFNQMPDIFEKFIYPDFRFELPSSEKEYKEKLIELFPDESISIEKYFQDVKDASFWFSRHSAIKSMPDFLSFPAQVLQSIFNDPSSITTEKYLDDNFKNPRLKAILASQWGDYGLPPSKSSFVIHALIVDHYLHGGFYPNGGAKKIAESVRRIVEENGGKLFVSHKVTEILFQGKKAVGVRVEEKKGGKTEYKDFFAQTIVSDASAYTTYKKLIPKTHEIPFLEELEEMTECPTSIVLFLGLNKDPREMGFQGENYWIYNSIDFESVFKNRNQALEGRPTISYLSFPSLKDKEAQGHTAEIISIVDYEPFQKWEHNEWKNRGRDYMELKEKITIGLIDSVEKQFPRFSSMIAYSELATPLSNIEFTGHKKGAIYGIPCTPERFQKKWLGPKTPFDNLYLTGADVAAPGIAGALAGGYLTLAHILGIDGLFGLIKKLRDFH